LNEVTSNEVNGSHIVQASGHIMWFGFGCVEIFDPGFILGVKIIQ